MNRCAFLSMDNLQEFECYDHMLIHPFKGAGWQVDVVSWREKETDWDKYEVVIIRSCWDYQKAPVDFLDTLKKIDLSTAWLVNSLKLVEWNIDKNYLKELEKKGVAIVPTLWLNHFNTADFHSFFTTFKTDEIIIKPLVGANSDNTFWLNESDPSYLLNSLSECFSNSPFLVQPFIKSVLTEGEYSLFYFGGRYSHAILKTPKKGDFRVQEEHGGTLTAVNPNELLLAAGKEAMRALPEQPFYARLDFVENNDTFLLMEAELIEPSLYFNMDSRSPVRFVEAFTKWWQSTGSVLQS